MDREHEWWLHSREAWPRNKQARLEAPALAAPLTMAGDAVGSWQLGKHKLAGICESTSKAKAKAGGGDDSKSCATASLRAQAFSWKERPDQQVSRAGCVPRARSSSCTSLGEDVGIAGTADVTYAMIQNMFSARSSSVSHSHNRS